jgi:hypothetical protein
MSTCRDGAARAAPLIAPRPVPRWCESAHRRRRVPPRANTINGRSVVVRTGILTSAFAKRKGTWKIEAQAWGRTS